MGIDDVIVYGDGTRAKILGFPLVNGKPGILVKPLDDEPLFLSDTLKERHYVERLVIAGVFRIEKVGLQQKDDE